jgi:Peptidase S46
MRSIKFLFLCFLLAPLPSQVFADEGLWLFTDPPTAQLQSKYHFTPTPAWLDHLQKSCVRVGDEASGCFVSPDGLVLTNQHVAAEFLQKLSDASHDYLANGFYAPTHEDEKRCPDLELNVLMAVEDVTHRVNAVVAPGMEPDQAFAARQKAIAEIQKETDNATGLHSEIVTLYGGASYQLYRYKRYTEVRLVFAPEKQAVFYGGDSDNCEYPRFALDICFFRAYENGKPAHVENYLKINADGPAANDLVFVSGNPYQTNRQLTVSALTNWRDFRLPVYEQVLYRQEVLFSTFGARSLENERRVATDLLVVQSDRKWTANVLDALLDPAFFEKAFQSEKAFRAELASLVSHGSGDGAAGQAALQAFNRIAQAEGDIAQSYNKYSFFEGSSFNPRGFDSELFYIARTLVRAAEERSKPNDERLPEFQDSNRETLELRLFSDAPIYDDVEELKLGGSLTDLAYRFGPTNPLIQQILSGKSPQERAVELVTGTRLKDVAARQQLYAGGAGALKPSSDPMLALAALVDPTARAARKVFDDAAETERQSYADIARARFALEGHAAYPDATFTLRLSYGPVVGYDENGRFIPPFTTFGDLYRQAAEHQNRPPFDLTKSWQDRQKRLLSQTKFNFVTTADTSGGSSGSPVVNEAGEFVGIVFDNNIQSLAWDFMFDDRQGRTVCVDSSAILEALDRIYGAKALLAELNGGAAADH